MQKDGSTIWTFEIVGISKYPEEPDMATSFIINNEYYDQARLGARGSTVARYVVKVANVQEVPAVMEVIDELFANSTSETVTISESESGQVRLRSMGDLDFVAQTVTGPAFVALLLSVGTMLMNSIRERTPELAIMKALGFANWRIISLIVLEVLIVFVAGAGVGLSAAWWLYPLAREYAGLVEMPGSVIVAGLGCAIVFGMACAWLPARHAMRLQIAQALTRQ